jgi:hypothetical protein
MRRSGVLRLVPCLVLVVVLPLPAFAEEEAAPRAAAERRLDALAKDDAAAAYRLALALQDEGFADLATRAHQRVLAADPDHPAARRALGFEKVDGRWLTGDDLFLAKGFVRVHGRWVLAEEAPPAERALAPLRRAALGLASERSEDRIRGAREIARLGDERGIRILVDAWTARSGPRASSGYFAQTRPMSYLRDFDVEVG